LEEAQRAAAELPTIAKAAAAGLTLEEYEDRENARRIPIKKAVDNFLSHAAKTKKQKTVAGYKLNLSQFVESVGKIHFLDKVGKDQRYMREGNATQSRRPDEEKGCGHNGQADPEIACIILGCFVRHR